MTREAIVAASPRVQIDTPTVRGSVSLRGGRLDDLALIKYRETVDPKSPPIVLLAPSGSPHPYYADFGWVAAAGSNVKVPTSDSVWTQVGSGTLGVNRPITLSFDNGEGLEFRRVMNVDENYLFTVEDSVINRGKDAVTLYPFGLISRHGRPELLGYYILHEGPIGFLGDKLQDPSYSDLESKKQIAFPNVVNGWLGITDKYWAVTLLPSIDAKLQARFAANDLNGIKTYQADYLLDAQTVQPGATGTATARLFAGASDLPNAERVIQTAWEVSPHPALALLYADLRPSESVADRAQRMLGLADLNPGHRESRFVRIEQRMALGQWDAAQGELEMLLQEGATSRLCSLMAAVAKGHGDDAAARDWLVLAATAPREPDWSDVEPDGLPFAFTDDDWARLVHVYGDSGQMIHPRYERYRPEALPTPSATLLPAVARISQFAEAPVDSGIYQGPNGGGDYVPRLAHVMEAEIADDLEDASREETADFDEDDDKKRSVLSWFRRG
mgnify:CR=1 FL=1